MHARFAFGALLILSFQVIARVFFSSRARLRNRVATSTFKPDWESLAVDGYVDRPTQISERTVGQLRHGSTNELAAFAGAIAFLGP